MKQLQLIGSIACLAALMVGCENTQTAAGNAEAKRAAALAERRQQEAQMDESEKNLSNAQQDRLNRDGSAYNSGRGD